MAIELAEIGIISEGELEVVGVDFTDEIDSDQVILTAAAVEVETDDHAATGDPTLADEQPNAAVEEFVDECGTRDVDIGKAALFTIEDTLSGTVYKIRVTVEVVLVDTVLVVRRLVRDIYIACL